MNYFFLLWMQTIPSYLIPWVLALALSVWNYLQLRRIETLKNSLQQKLTVHKLQFEKEFEVYKEIWSQLYLLGDILQLLRPQADLSEPGKSYDETINSRLQKAVMEGNKLIDLTEANRPFYAAEIYRLLTEMNRLVKVEIIEVKFRGNPKATYWEEGAATIKNYLAKADAISDAIRSRIGNMNEIL
jgi:hypothetical protein